MNSSTSTMAINVPLLLVSMTEELTKQLSEESVENTWQLMLKIAEIKFIDLPDFEKLDNSRLIERSNADLNSCGEVYKSIQKHFEGNVCLTPTQ